MQRERREQHQDAARDPRPVAMMPVRAERGAGAREREIGAGDDAERAVERHGQHAAQRRQRSPHLGMLHEISEVFIGRETKPRGGAIDHGVHRIGERPAPRRDRDDDEDLDGFLGQRDPEHRMQGLRDPGIFGEPRDIAANGARATPNSEMLAAPSRNAAHTLAGGPGRSPAAITSHRISSAGATAAVPMTVGRDSSRFIEVADMPFFRLSTALNFDRLGTSRRAASKGRTCAKGGIRSASSAQQPLQMFLSVRSPAPLRR